MSPFRLAPWTVILLSASVLVTISLGIRQSMGLFLAPISLELGSGRELFSFALAIQNLLWGLSSPLFGAVADKIGGWRVAALGGVLYAVGLVILSQIVTPFGTIFGNVMIGLGLGSAGMAVAIGAVSRAAPPAKRSLALGFVTSLGSFGQFALVPVAQLLIGGYGWHTALLLMSAVAATMIGFSFGLREKPGDTKVKHVATASLRHTFYHALSSRDYLLLASGFFVCGLQLVFIGVHLPVYLADNGIDPSIASWALALIGLFNIFGALFFGWIGGVTSKRIPLALIYLMRTVIIAVFITLPVTGTSALVFGALMGLLWLGTIPLTSGLVITFFGPRYMATLYGVVFLSHQVGSFFGAWLGGLVYDLTDNYDVMWVIMLASGVIAFALHIMIREREVVIPPEALRT